MRWLLRWVLLRLGSRAMVGIAATLLILNLLIPDPIPLIDEILMLVGTVLLSRWAKTEEVVMKEEENTLKHAGRGRTQR